MRPETAAALGVPRCKEIKQKRYSCMSPETAAALGVPRCREIEEPVVKPKTKP